MFNYCVKVDFDDRIASKEQRDIYSGVIDKYIALAFGNDDGTSTLVFNLDNPINKNSLARELKGIKILSFEKNQ